MKIRFKKNTISQDFSKCRPQAGDKGGIVDHRTHQHSNNFIHSEPAEALNVYTFTSVRVTFGDTKILVDNAKLDVRTTSGFFRILGDNIQKTGGASWQQETSTTNSFFETMSKRRRGYPSETHVKRGIRIVHGDKLLEEKLGRNDLCPCGSKKRFKKCCLKSGAFDGVNRDDYF